MSLTRTCEILLLRTRPDGAAEVLLGVKKRGLGQGKMIGPGGHIEEGETAAQATARELKEETGLTVDVADLIPLGGIEFRFSSRPDQDLHVAVFRCERFEGEPVETDELTPGWIPADALPFDRMWPDAQLWLPRALDGQILDAVITLAEDGETVADARFR